MLKVHRNHYLGLPACIIQQKLLQISALKSDTLLKRNNLQLLLCKDSNLQISLL